MAELDQGYGARLRRGTGKRKTRHTGRQLRELLSFGRLSYLKTTGTIGTIETIGTVPEVQKFPFFPIGRRLRPVNDVGKTHEDLERFLAEHHLVGAGLRREGRAAPRQGKSAGHRCWGGILKRL